MLSEFQKRIDKYFRKDLEIEVHLSHIGEDFGIDNILDTLDFLRKNKIPFLIETPLEPIDTSNTDIVANLTKKDIFKLCTFCNEKKWPLPCIHISRLPRKITKEDGNKIIKGLYIEFVDDPTYIPQVRRFLTCETVEGYLEIFDAVERVWNEALGLKKSPSN